MTLSGISKFILGVLLAAAILFGAGISLTRYLLARLATPPPRPVFANDPSPSPVAAVAASPAPAAEATPAASPTPESSPSPSPSQGYQARVVQPIGLILRQDASAEAPQVGGVEYNQEIVVLEDSPDGGWQKVRLGNGTEGWVKGGNTERIN